MATQFGVGYSEQADSRQAGVEAATAAMAEAGAGRCDLALLFSTGKHGPRQLRDGVRSVIGPGARLIGGYSAGAITRDKLGYEGFQVVVGVMSSDSIQVDMFIEGGLSGNERVVGRALGRQIRSRTYSGEPNILLMYDSVRESAIEGANLNLASPLLAGMTESLGTWPRAAGVGMMGDMHWNPTYQWFDDRIEQHSAMALVLSGGVRLDTIIMHGCKPGSAYHTITRADGAAVLEIDGRPALEVIAELIGPDSDRSWEEYPIFVTLGLNKGDKFGPYREEDYANRIGMAVDKERGAIIMFEDDLKTGDEVQLMRRSIDFEYIGARTRDLLARVGDRRPLFAFYIDCTGRAATYCGTEREEAEEVQKVIGPRMPLLGVYSGKEIAKVGASMQALNLTGVLCLLSE